MTKTTIIIPLDSSITDIKSILNKTIEVTTKDEADIIVVDTAHSGLGESLDAYGVKYISYTADTIAAACNYVVREVDTTDNDILILDGGYPVSSDWLQELKKVADVSEKHGIIAAKSNAMQARSDDEHVFDIGLSLDQFNKTANLYPEYTLCPILPSPCIYIRRSLIKNLGLFDEQFDNLTDAKIDYSLRLSPYTISSVLAHKVFVQSTIKDVTPHVINEQVAHRYKYLNGVIVQYTYNNVYALDRFIDEISDTSVIKVNFSMLRVPATYNGTSRNALSFLKYIISNSPKNMLFTVTATQEVIDFFKLNDMGIRVVTPEEIHKSREKFHVGYTPCQPFYINEILFLNKCCLKIVVSHLDVISLRRVRDITEFFDVRSGTMEYLEWVDGIINISDFTYKDTKDYFYPIKIDEKKVTTIHQGYPGATFDLEQDTTYEFKEIKSVLNGDYIFMSGHSDPHKAVEDVVKSLGIGGSPIPIIILGTKSGSDKSKNLYFMKSGGVPESLLQKIQANARIFLFPSYAEGFGFPIAEAAHYDAPIILNNTGISHETSSIYPDLSAYFFDQFDEIPGLVKTILQSKKNTRKPKNIRTLDDYNREVVEYVHSVGRQPVDMKRLNDRINHFVNIDNFIGISRIGTMPTVDAPWLLIAKIVTKKTLPKRMHAPMASVYKAVKPRIKKIVGIKE